MVKKFTKSLIARFGRQHWNFGGHELLVLMYHRVLPSDYPGLDKIQPGMWIHPKTLEKQLQIIKKMFDVVFLEDWVEARQNGDSLPKKACAITFDDGWIDNYEYAFPILQQEKVPASIYLATRYVGTNEHFFPERLIRIIARDGKAGRRPAEGWLQEIMSVADDSPSVLSGPEYSDYLNRAVVEAKRYGDIELRAMLSDAEHSRGLETSYDPPDLLNWEQVGQMGDSELIRFGVHTRTHLRFDREHDPQLMIDEIVHSKEELLSRTGQRDALFCYPNGDSTNKAEELVRANYAAALTTVCGWNNSRTDLHKLSRIGLSDGHGHGEDFLCRLSGWI